MIDGKELELLRNLIGKIQGQFAFEWNEEIKDAPKYSGRFNNAVYTHDYQINYVLNALKEIEEQQFKESE